MIDEFLIRPDTDGKPRVAHIADSKANILNPKLEIFLHGHCYQKAQPPAGDGYPTGASATIAMLQAVGHTVRLIDDGCCGMAGAFGYETEHYDLSMQIGGLALFPAIQASLQGAARNIIHTAPGVSCRSQIEDSTGLKVSHPIAFLLYNSDVE
jgi:hypothetical protein